MRVFLKLKSGLILFMGLLTDQHELKSSIVVDWGGETVEATLAKVEPRYTIYSQQ